MPRRRPRLTLPAKLLLLSPWLALGGFFLALLLDSPPAGKPQEYIATVVWELSPKPMFEGINP